MFRDANKKAAEFTLPIVISRKTVEGRCASSIGACVVVNDEGWVVTAAHVFDAFNAMIEQREATNAAENEIEKITSDEGLSSKEKQRAVFRIRPKKTDTKECSIRQLGVKHQVSAY